MASTSIKIINENGTVKEIPLYTSLEDTLEDSSLILSSEDGDTSLGDIADLASSDGTPIAFRFDTPIAVYIDGKQYIFGSTVVARTGKTFTLKKVYDSEDAMAADNNNLSAYDFVQAGNDIYVKLSDDKGFLHLGSVSTTSIAQDTPTENSTSLITSGGVYTALTAETTARKSADSALDTRVTANEKAIVTINGTGEGSISKAVTDGIASHISDTPNPHNVTAEQVGLGSVANTGDSATPVENGTTKFTTGGAYTELAKKNDKITITDDSTTALSDTSTISTFSSEGTNPTAVTKRPLSLFWTYISGKISSVLGLTKTSYGGNASTATKLGTTDVGTETNPIYLKKGTATNGSTYAGGTAVTLNGNSMAGSTASFYAPAGAGTSGQYLKSSGTNAPAWQSLDTTPTSGSENALTSGAIYSALAGKENYKVGYSETTSSPTYTYALLATATLKATANFDYKNRFFVRMTGCGWYASAYLNLNFRWTKSAMSNARYNWSEISATGTKYADYLTSYVIPYYVYTAGESCVCNIYFTNKKVSTYFRVWIYGEKGSQGDFGNSDALDDSSWAFNTIGNTDGTDTLTGTKAVMSGYTSVANAEIATSARKVEKSLSINGQTFNGSAAIDAGTIGIGYGGTGAKTAAAAAGNLGACAYCSTAAATAAKVATMPSFKLVAGAQFRIYIATANTAASALTLNVNDTGAKTIYVNGTVTSSSSYTLAAGWYSAVYDGTNYQLKNTGTLIQPQAEKATADANGNTITSTYLKLSGGTMTGTLAVGHENATAIGSAGAKSNTIGDLINELRYTSGQIGSFSLTTAYTKDDVTISTGWYNYIWVPHRCGGAFGSENGDNCNYGTLYLSGMTSSNEVYVIRYSSKSIVHLSRLVSASELSDLASRVKALEKMLNGTSTDTVTINNLSVSTKLTIPTSAPSDPANGDLWIE